MRDLGRRLGGLLRLGLMWSRFPAARSAGIVFIDRGADVFFDRAADVRFGRGARFMRDATIRVFGRLSVGDGTFFNRGCTIVARDTVTIGRNCLFGPRVSVFDHDHGLLPTSQPPGDRAFVSAPISIEDNVWLGAGVTVLRGVTIGFGSVVAANSVVTRDVPPRTLVGGTPAVRLRALD